MQAIGNAEDIHHSLNSYRSSTIPSLSDARTPEAALLYKL
ncbi:MAG: hypothetical protein NMNS01_30010 [Nitrosomonas sp.]|nr:MAG: hypothetical protein NMNS01_30010 [Nitrosomonas sp.]